MTLPTESGFSLFIDGSSVTPSATMPIRNPATAEIFRGGASRGSGRAGSGGSRSDACVPSMAGYTNDRSESRVDRGGRRSSKLMRTNSRRCSPGNRAVRYPARGPKFSALRCGSRRRPCSRSRSKSRRIRRTRRIEVHHVPLGVVCGIVPWNFPILLAIWKIAPALMAGNTMVLKPSPFTPLTTLRIGALIGGCFPTGVLNVICGDDALGPLMTAHKGFAKITFTGSTATGRRVMEAAAKDLKRIYTRAGRKRCGDSHAGRRCRCGRRPTL